MDEEVRVQQRLPAALEDEEQGREQREPDEERAGVDHRRGQPVAHLDARAGHRGRHRREGEAGDEADNEEPRRPPEREQPLATELARYLSQGETAQVIEADNGALQVLALQGAATRSLLMEGALDAAGFAELQRQLRGLHELQGRSERIKDFPYPRQHAFINALFLRILCVLVPFGMLGEAERLNGLVSGWAQGQMVWLTIPLSLLVSWMYTSLDQVGESTENPFEGGANDVPISAICQDIERDLREVLGEGSVPRAMRQAGDITV